MNQVLRSCFGLLAVLLFSFPALAADGISAVRPADNEKDVDTQMSFVWKLEMASPDYKVANAVYSLTYGASGHTPSTIGNLTRTLYSPSARLSPATLYVWNVDAEVPYETLNASGDVVASGTVTVRSPGFSFSTKSANPEDLGPKNPEPADGAGLDDDENRMPTTFTARWDRGKDENGQAPARYEVFFGEDCANIQGWVCGTATDPLFTFSGLKEETTYYWYVITYSIGGQAVIGPVWTFATIRDTERGDISGGCNVGFAAGALFLVTVPALVFMGKKLKKR